MAYIMCGSVAKAARMVGVPDGTFRKWVASPWWTSAIDYARKVKMGELHGQLSEIIHLAVDKVKERLEKGDEAINAKTGEKVYKSVNARDAAFIASLFMEKREITERVMLPDNSKGQEGTLDDMKSEFEQEDAVH